MNTPLSENDVLDIELGRVPAAEAIEVLLRERRELLDDIAFITQFHPNETE